jgi:hypothetical protein
MLEEGELAKSDRDRALVYFGAASAAVITGVAVAAARFPGGFDWMYTVISRLGSQTHNPDGAVWLAVSLLCATILLWPVARHLGRVSGAGGVRPALPLIALRVGLVGGGLLAVESLLMLDLSRIGRKGHEALALATFLGLYGGVMGFYYHRVRHAASSLWPALLVVLPLCAVGLSQLALYFDQRELGWVHTAWREMGVPVWLSFAFWQWLAVWFLGLGLGYLVLWEPRRRIGASGPTARASPPTAGDG